jgi:hypothetical protein
MKLRLFKDCLIFVSCLFLANHSAWAYFETAESGEISKLGHYKIGLIPQIRLSEGSGMNFTGFFDSAINDESSVRFLLGSGETDFVTGGSFKWIPIPDYQQQPAIGGKLEVLYGRESSDSFVSFRFHPLISKKYDIDYGTLTAFGSVPISFTTFKNNTETQFNVVLGTEFRNPDYENWEFGSELGLNGNKSFTYISVWATVFLDEEKGFQKR